MNEKEKGGFYVKNYVKLAAINSVYINGRSYHLRPIYKSTVFSESILLRRLCERVSDYLEALSVLKVKWLNSYYCKDLVARNYKTIEGTLWTD